MASSSVSILSASAEQLDGFLMAQQLLVRRPGRLMTWTLLAGTQWGARLLKEAPLGIQVDAMV